MKNCDFWKLLKTELSVLQMNSSYNIQYIMYVYMYVCVCVCVCIA